MEDGKQFHINIYKDNKEGIDASNNRAEAYIILANEELNNKNREILAELKELQSQNDTLTEENERMEVTITNQRGMLHNLHGLNKLESNLSTHIGKINKDYGAQVDKFKNYHDNYVDNIGKFFAYLTIFMLFQLGIGIIDYSSLILFALNVSFLFYVTIKLHGQSESHYTIVKTHSSFRGKISSQVKEIKNEIDEIKRSTDHISNFIDSL